MSLKTNPKRRVADMNWWTPLMAFAGFWLGGALVTWFLIYRGEEDEDDLLGPFGNFLVCLLTWPAWFLGKWGKK